ncbi:glycosyltransferase [Mucilaginibacter sp. cycad4]|uniref:glycosyltransferase family 4 protein n=1 Tax=Mucilaginibacter sp. cycad4 TaxID=3342096 RepID=UPI002AAAC281|nr:glycosyltransferase [Mucilaginibacter gossypii]WPV02491.1 glycosyltransferase [Mucilaginibacter gossypii]
MDNRKKTLLILSPGFPENEADTTCLPPQQVFVRALKAENQELNIIVLSFQYPFSAAEYDWHGVRVVSFGGRGRGKLFRLNTWLKVWQTLGHLNRQYQIVGLLSFWLGECALVGHYFARIKNIKHRCWMLGQDAKAGNKYAKWIKPKGDELIALSDFIVREFIKNYHVKPLNIIPVGIDTSLFDVLSAENDIDILGAGSLIPLKQFHLFIEAVAMLKQYYPDIKTVICGDGPEKEKLLGQIKAKQLESNITLAGELQHHEVLKMMQRSRVLFHPSEYEGFGAVCLEALYSGAEVVSFVKPMDDDITNWHIVNNMEEAWQTIRCILDKPDCGKKNVLAYEIRDNVRRMMEVFEQ